MKYVKIIIKGNKEPLYLSLEKWGSILADEKNLVAFKLDNEEEWTGRVLNKLDVSYAEYDREYSEKANQPKFGIYRRKSDGVVVKLLDGQLPDDFDNYEKV